MDYLTRLIAGASTSPTKQRPNTAAERLATCEKLCKALQHLWRSGNIGPEDEPTANRATELLTRLNNILHDESRKAAPHSCLSHVASSQIYIITVKIALLSQNQEVVCSTAQLFHILINGEAEGLLDSRLFSRALLDLVRYTVVDVRKSVDQQTEADLVELLFEIATKIRLDPDLLPAWFHPERERSRPRNAQGETRRNQFPLFWVLVQYHHHDGPVGDFARTGLLYLTETASKSTSLETWMIESDLAPQMASGLGALYSSLSRSFPALDEREKAVPILALSDPSTAGGDPNETSDAFRKDLQSFLSYLAFWQDTLNHCTSVEVRDTLLDHFQVLFVQQLLYPSLLESSDVDGGSTAAVVAHLARMLLAMDHSLLAQRMLPYLLASKATGLAKEQQKHKPRLSISRRKSLDHLAALAEAAQSPSPNLFNLLDLIVMGLKSIHVNTVNTCLKLLAVILNKHHASVLLGLFRTEPANPAAVDRSVKTFNNMLIKLFDLADATAPSDTMDDSYQATLTDTKIRLERHSCSRHSAEEQPPTMMIASDCRLLDSLFALLSTFFANDTVTNLLLTEVLMSVAACEYLSLQGWLLSSTDHTQPESQPQDVMSLIRILVDQVRGWHSQYDEWDDLISNRRKELTDADETPGTSHVRSVSGEAKISNFNIGPPSPVTAPRQVSRPTTPRVRPVSGTEFGSIDGNLSPSPKPRANLMPRAVAGSPLRKAYIPADQDEVSSLRSASPGLSSMKDVLDTQVALSTYRTSVGPPSTLPFLVLKAQFEKKAASDESNTAISDTDSGAVTPNLRGEERLTRTHVSLSHVLTNAIILQEFILEIAAAVQVRGTLFLEVDLSHPPAVASDGEKADQGKEGHII